MLHVGRIWDGPCGTQEETVLVPLMESPITDVQFDTLKDAIDPLEEQDDYGIGLHSATRTFVYEL